MEDLVLVLLISFLFLILFLDYPSKIHLNGEYLLVV